jgi:hypothetical protein
MPERINHVSVWVAAIAYFIFGAVWFTVFGGAWRSMVPNPAAPGAGLYIESFILGLILAYATAIALMRRPEDQTVQHGVGFAVFMGVAVFATQTLNVWLYEGRPLGLWLIDAAYVVIGFAIVGAIVGGWKKRVAVTTDHVTR